MWKSLGKTLLPIIKEAPFLKPEIVLADQLRTTYILKRRHTPYLHKNGSHPKRLRSRHYIYDLVENTEDKPKPDIDVILTTFVDGLGNVGDKVKVKPNYAHNHLLLPGLAVYASPENLEKFKNYERKEGDVVYSSSTALLTIGTLSRLALSVVMNKDNPWTIQPWHIKASFRKCGFHVPESAIAVPATPIKGPNMELENKEFYVTVTINKTEKVNVRCIVHHWSTDILERLPHQPNFWETPNAPILTEQGELLASLAKLRVASKLRKLK